MRAGLEQKPVDDADQLGKAISQEIGYQEAMWNGDYVGAMNCARAVLTEMKSSRLRGYRCLWGYLAGSAAFLAMKFNNANLGDASKQFFYEAARQSNGITWLKALGHYGGKDQQAPTPSRDGALLERIESFLEEIGCHTDQKIAEYEKKLREGLASSERGPFESAHVLLGRMLGYEAGNKETPGAPDPWWMVDDKLCLIFEDHAKGKLGGSIDVEKARQVSSHPKWVRANLKVSADAEIVPVLVSPAKSADTDAFPHLEGVFYWALNEFRDWAEKAIGAIREARSTYPGVSGDMIWRDELRAILRREGVDLDTLLKTLKSSDARKVLAKK